MGEKQMNETKKVNEISSKKNFGKYSKKVHRRSDKAITLIALIVTIIVNRVYYDKNKKYSNLVGSPIIYINL